MDISLKNKNALVCGASQGIGAATAIEFAKQGANVCLLARTEEKLEALSKKISRDYGVSSTFIAVDITDHDTLSESIRSKTKEFGEFHILVNNTGGPKSSLLLDAELATFENAFKAHVLTAQVLTQLLIPGMRNKSYGRIINIISTSVKQPIPNLGVSNTIRGAMASWAKTLSRELDPFITINNVLPGYTETERLENLAKSISEKNKQSIETVYSEWKKTIPAKRFGKPEELAAALTFLASPAAAYINGINLPVDGGRLMTL